MNFSDSGYRFSIGYVYVSICKCVCVCVLTYLSCSTISFYGLLQHLGSQPGALAGTTGQEM